MRSLRSEGYMSHLWNYHGIHVNRDGISAAKVALSRTILFITVARESLFVTISSKILVLNT